MVFRAKMCSRGESFELIFDPKCLIVSPDLCRPFGRPDPFLAKMYKSFGVILQVFFGIFSEFYAFGFVVFFSEFKK